MLEATTTAVYGERMDIHTITQNYSVGPQIDAADLSALCDAGFTDVICNRPDVEVPPEQDSAVMRAAAEDAGLRFHVNPVTNGALTLAEIERQTDVANQAEGKVFAYCRSGTRSTVVWALGQAGRMPVEDILAAAARGGYDLNHLRPQIEAMAGR